MYTCITFFSLVGSRTKVMSKLWCFSFGRAVLDYCFWCWALCYKRYSILWLNKSVSVLLESIVFGIFIIESIVKMKKLYMNDYLKRCNIGTLFSNSTGSLILASDSRLSVPRPTAPWSLTMMVGCTIVCDHGQFHIRRMPSVPKTHW